MTMMMFYGGAPLQWWPVARPALCRTIERLPTNTSFVKRCHLHQYVQYLYLFQFFVRPPSSNSDIFVYIENHINHSHTKKRFVYRDNALQYTKKITFCLFVRWRFSKICQNWRYHNICAKNNICALQRNICKVLGPLKTALHRRLEVSTYHPLPSDVTQQTFTPWDLPNQVLCFE